MYNYIYIYRDWAESKGDFCIKSCINNQKPTENAKNDSQESDEFVKLVVLVICWLTI